MSATAHSRLLGGSGMAAMFACPANFQTRLKLPPSVEVSSSYAEKGSDMHAAMEIYVRERMTDPAQLIGRVVRK